MNKCLLQPRDGYDHYIILCNPHDAKVKACWRELEEYEGCDASIPEEVVFCPQHTDETKECAGVEEDLID